MPPRGSENLAGSLEGPASVHAQVVVHEGEVASLPIQIKGYPVRQFADPFDFRRIETRAIAISDRLRRVVPGILPPFESGDELVEEAALSVVQFRTAGRVGEVTRNSSCSIHSHEYSSLESRASASSRKSTLRVLCQLRPIPEPKSASAGIAFEYLSPFVRQFWPNSGNSFSIRSQSTSERQRGVEPPSSAAFWQKKKSLLG